MNCHDFEQIVLDLARQTSIEAALRGSALAHADNCARCAARLAGERAITSSLKVIAVGDQSMSAPGQIEANLLSAFRQQATLRLVESTERRAAAWSLWALAAAAAVILVLGLIVYRMLLASTDKPEPIVFHPSATVAPSNDPLVKPEEPAPSISLEERRLQRMTPRPPDRRLQAVSDRHHASLKLQRFLIRDGMTLYGGESESVTDFLPLAYASNLPQMESGQLIRVRMPRSALVKFGLPVNVELSNIPVSADVLVGDDGLARAIRFVR